MAPGWHTQDPVDTGGIPLDKDAKRARALLRAYYLEARIDSPMGGFLEPLGVRAESDGSGTAFFECSASSLRFTLSIPKATRTERKRVKERLDAGEDGLCPRHEDPPRRLHRVGADLVCPACGVRYARAP
jgi:hypothetical protein